MHLWAARVVFEGFWCISGLEVLFSMQTGLTGTKSDRSVSSPPLSFFVELYSKAATCDSV